MIQVYPSEYVNLKGRFFSQHLYEFAYLKTADENGVIVEIDSPLWKSTAYMAEMVRYNAKKVDFYTVTDFKYKRNYDIFDIDSSTNLRDLYEFQICRANSVDNVTLIEYDHPTEAYKFFADKTVDFLMFCEDYEDDIVYQALQNWYPKMKDHCVMGGINFRTNMEPIRKFFEEKFICVHNSTKNLAWYVYKTSDRYGE
jgi:hypothetical protein